MNRGSIFAIIYPLWSDPRPFDPLETCEVRVASIRTNPPAGFQTRSRNI